MLLGILFILIVAGACGVPLLPVLISGALLQAVAGYWLSRDVRIVRYAIAGTVMLLSHAMLYVCNEGNEIVDAETFTKLNSLFMVLDYMQAVMVIGVSTVLGIRGPVSEANNSTGKRRSKPAPSSPA
jgi:hypothetical protein